PKRRFEDDEPNTSRKSPKYESQVTDDFVDTILQKIDERISKRPCEDHEPESSRKARKQNPWKEYQAVDGPVDLPPALINLIEKCDVFKPESRDKFKQELDGKTTGDQITLPSIGQEPKEYGIGFQGNSFFITEQMMEVWEEFSTDSKKSIKKVLAGPMGVGKSYLALFLAAKAYSEGWLVLYVSDAGGLVTESIGETGVQLCSRFFALNKDILTVADFKSMLQGAPSDPSSEEAATLAAGSILSKLLNQVDQNKNNKTLFVIDEHGKLFEENRRRPNLFQQLHDIHSWDPARNGARVIYTGTAHAGFELIVLTGDIETMLEFVGPFTDTIFYELLKSSPIPLSKPPVFDKVTETTNNVPRELIKLVKFIEDKFKGRKPNEEEILERIGEFASIRCTKFTGLAMTYFTNHLNDTQQMDQRTALSIMFQPNSQGNLQRNITFVEPKFMDLGLIFRVKESGETKYKFLCPSARRALLEIYRTMPLPIDKVRSLENGAATGEDFEEVFFRYIMWYKKLSFRATDLVGEYRTDINIDAKDFDIAEKPFTEVKPDTFRRLSKDYPRFDFVYNRTFFQLSKSSFGVHDTDSSRISKAFDPPKAKVNGKVSKDTSGTQMETSTGSSKGSDSTSKKKQNAKDTKPIETRNQIEVYLDAAYGGKHVIKINSDTNHFEASRDGVRLDDFRIVFVCGLADKPNHIDLVKRYPDLLYVSLKELKSVLFGDLYGGHGNRKDKGKDNGKGKGEVLAHSNERDSAESSNSSPGP
ncbi:hypothetical protein BGZ46_002860, partial [Entomortierella lignicola]